MGSGSRGCFSPRLRVRQGRNSGAYGIGIMKGHIQAENFPGGCGLSYAGDRPDQEGELSQVISSLLLSFTSVCGL